MERLGLSHEFRQHHIDLGSVGIPQMRKGRVEKSIVAAILGMGGTEARDMRLGRRGGALLAEMGLGALAASVA